MNSDAKVLLLYVQGLPDSATDRPLGELARKLDMKGRSYQQAKKQLTEHGYFHEWRSQGDGGRWTTEQLFSNTPLTRDEAGAVRAKLSPEAGQLARHEQQPCPPPPGAQFPTVGGPTPRPVGGYEPEEEHYEETTPHPPSDPKPKPKPKPKPHPKPHPKPDPESEGAPAPDPETAPTPRQLARAERVLLSLRHSRRELLLGVGEARALAGKAAEWLERGVTESDLRHALLAERPKEGVHSAFGFLGHRLTHKCPVPPAPAAPPEPPPPPVRALIVCAGTDAEEHLFRPLGDETECAECRRATAYASWMVDTDTYDFPPDMTWRQRFVAVAKADALRGRTA
ncbi:hypothetical protein [Streptomyces sp. CB00316]|uniref:hypothetical protein n=1 Tax=Streptomyces sp. CB00316 TaxID=1703932 RepID=UPI000D19A202|nr:hypothetical protein [Streptomyces sp. CB00316]